MLIHTAQNYHFLFCSWFLKRSALHICRTQTGMSTRAFCKHCTSTICHILVICHQIKYGFSWGKKENNLIFQLTLIFIYVYENPKCLFNKKQLLNCNKINKFSLIIIKIIETVFLLQWSYCKMESRFYFKSRPVQNFICSNRWKCVFATNMMLRIKSKISLLFESVVGIHFLWRDEYKVLVMMTGI